MVTRRIVQINQQGAANTVGRSDSVDLAALRSVDRSRRSARSAELVAAVQQLDTTTDPVALQKIMDWITEEYEKRQGGRLIGLYGKCYLGDPYLDHRFDLSGSMIIEHYTRTDDPPPPFRPARPLAASGAYMYVEVYDDGAVVPIRPDGRPVV